MKTTLLTILVFTLISCDAASEEFVGSSWKVMKLKTNGTSVDVTNDVILKVNSDTDFSLKLDTNNCFGTYAITGKTEIKLAGIACTEMCCDSEFSQAVVKALHQVSKIKLKEEYATLSSDEVEITFKRIEDSSESKEKAMSTEKAFTQKEKESTEATTNVGKFEKPDVTQATNNTVPKGLPIELYKSPCKGTCEEFYMKFYEDGTVLYTGKYNAQVQGKRAVQISPSKSTSLFTAFEQSNFMNFLGKYDDPRIMDIQNTYLTYNGKKIEIRFQSEAPKELQALLEKVEAQAQEVLQKLKEY